MSPRSPATALQKLRQFKALRRPPGFGERWRQCADDRVPRMRRKENCASSSDDFIEQVSLKRKASIALAALFVCFFMVIEGTRERYDERPKRATFLGFTNTGPDQVNAIIRFPSVHPRAPASTFFYKPIYDIDFEIEYINSAGRRTTQRLGDRLYFSAGLPVGEADLLAPVPHDAVAMTLLKAEGVLASRARQRAIWMETSSTKRAKVEVSNGSNLDRGHKCTGYFGFVIFRTLRCRSDPNLELEL